MDQTVNVTFWVTGFVFVVVNLFMAWAVIRYRHRKGRTEKAAYEPENKKLEWWLTDHHLGRHRGDARARPRRVGEVRHAAGGRHDRRSGRPAVGLELSLPRPRRRARRVRQQAGDARQSVRHRSQGSEGSGRRAGHLARAAPADRQAREVPAAREGREPSVRRAAVPREDGHGARHGHLFLADADAHRRASTRCASSCAAWRTSRCAAASSSTKRRSSRRGSPRSRRSRRRPRRRRAIPKRARRCSRPAPRVTATQAQGNKELGAPKLARPGRLVPRAAAAELQARRARLARERHLRQADDPVRVDARRRRGGPQRRRVHRLAARSAPRRQRRRQPGARQEAVCDLRCVPRRRRARASGPRTRRACRA